ncbi:MAG: MarR family transcriptional regulator [Chloroflexota bacterium]
MMLLTERYASQIAGVLSCYDRIIITGTLPGVCFPEGMARYLRFKGVRLFDYTPFAEPLRDKIRQNAERVAQEHGLDIEFIRSAHAFRKEDRIRAILQQRGNQPGLVHIFSAMEPCPAFTPWYDKTTGKTTLRYKDGKCLHYYFYFIDDEFGLCYLRVPTWAPFRLQFYCNGHHWLAGQLQQAGIAFQQLDNSFSSIADFARAQALADAFPIERLHRALDGFAARYCPISEHFGATYHWSIMQVEYATDLVFHRQADLHPLYDTLVRTAIHAVKADNVATFLGHKLTGNYRDELGNDFHTRIEGTRIKHHMGPVSIKLYDKQGLVLRIETTANDVSFFRHHRTVEHRDGTATAKLAPVQKTIYSLGVVRALLGAANQRYLAFLSELTDPSAGVDKAQRLADPAIKDGRHSRGFNLFARHDLALFHALARGEWTIGGLHNATLRQHLPGASGPQVSRLLRRLRDHGLLKKIGRTYKYHLTRLGREVTLTALKLRELVVIPALAGLLP